MWLARLQLLLMISRWRTLRSESKECFACCLPGPYLPRPREVELHRQTLPGPHCTTKANEHPRLCGAGSDTDNNGPGNSPPGTSAAPWNGSQSLSEPCSTTRRYRGQMEAGHSPLDSHATRLRTDITMSSKDFHPSISSSPSSMDHSSSIASAM